MLAAALLRQLWAVITTGQAWDPAIAANGLTRPIASVEVPIRNRVATKMNLRPSLSPSRAKKKPPMGRATMPSA